jgi:small subunit ribosomal protein S21
MTGCSTAIVERFCWEPRKTAGLPKLKTGNGDNVQVLVRDNNVDQALRALKKKLQREGVFREMKLRNFFEKPSVKRAREKAEAIRRTRKLARKKLQREGMIQGR